MLPKNVLFLQVNGNKSHIAMKTIRDLGFELLEHPPYCPDLALSDYQLFPQFKKSQIFCNEDVIEAVEG
jgi:hypothetical protein